MRRRSTVNGEMRVEDDYDAYYNEEVVGGVEKMALLNNNAFNDVQQNGLPGLYSTKPRMTPSALNGGFPNVGNQNDPKDMRAQFNDEV